MELDPDSREFVEFLNAEGFRYLLIGGYVLAAHGAMRYTGDFETWVWADPENAARILRALAAFGFGSLPIELEGLTRRDSVIELGDPPHRIDLLRPIDGVEFDDAWGRRIQTTFGVLEIPTIRRTDLIANEQAVGRPRDLADLDALGADAG